MIIVTEKCNTLVAHSLSYVPAHVDNIRHTNLLFERSVYRSLGRLSSLSHVSYACGSPCHGEIVDCDWVLNEINDSGKLEVGALENSAWLCSKMINTTWANLIQNTIGPKLSILKRYNI